MIRPGASSAPSRAPRVLFRVPGLDRPRLVVARLLLPGLLVLAACGGDDAGPAGPSAEARVTTISVSPPSATLTAIDDTQQLTASAADQVGATMSGVSFNWSSSDEDVATVDGSGVVTARGNGSATITAAASGRQGTATVTVAQTTTSVEVSPAEATFEQGQQFQFEALAEDANGHPLSADRFTWSSTDTEVVTVDQDGLATGEAVGEAAIQASVDGVVGEAEVTIEPTTSPLVTSVSPDPLVEGQTATITGVNFSPTPAENQVLVDGDQAQVTSASETQLQIVVPSGDCRPSRTVALTVTVGDASSPSHAAAVTPGETGLQMSVGEHLLLEDPDDFCLRFDESPGTEAYLVGVQSTSEVAATLTPVSIRSVTASGQAEGEAGGSAALVPRLSLDPTHLTGDGGRAPPPSDARWVAHRESEGGLRQWEREMLRSAGPAATAEPPGPFRLFASVPQVGDVRTLRVPDRRQGDLCADFVGVDAVVRAVGSHGIWLEDPDNPANGFTAADFQSFSDQFDQTIYATNVEYFGEPTDLDGNERILVLVSKAVNVTSSGASLGFVFSGDFFPRADCPASDEGEIFYGAAPDPGGTFGPAYATADARLDFPFIIAHELSHVIQVGRRLMDGAPLMDTWMMEGQATLAEEVVGHAVTGRSPGQNYGYAVAFNILGTDEVDWYTSGFIGLAFYYGFQSQTSRVTGAPEECSWLRLDGSPCLGPPLWYGVPWSLLRWASDQFGADHAGGEAGLHRAIVDGGLTGFGPLTDVTGETRERLLAWWAATLYTDGRVSGPRLGMSSWNLFQIFQNLVQTARLTPLEVSFSDFQASGSVRASSTAYLRLQGSGRPETALRVRDVGDGQLPAQMQVWVVRLQ